MANRIPVKAIFTGSDVTALGEFASGDTIDVSYIADGTITAAKLAADTATQAELDTVSTVASAALPKAGGTMTGDLNFGNNVDINVGAGAALKIYYDGTNSYITESGGGGNLCIRGQQIRLEKADGAVMMELFNDAGVDIKYDAATKLSTSANGVTVTGAAVGTLTTDNDGSFALSASNHFKCTPSGNFTLTFTSIVSQSGNILLVNSGGHTVSAHANTKVDAKFLSTISTAGTYLLAYFSDGTNVYMTNSAIYT